MNSGNFEIVNVSSQAAMNTPTDKYFDLNGVYAYSTLIPETNRVAKRVHFVSGSNGDEFGQFPTKERALTEANRLSKMSECERAQYDR